MEFVKKLWNYQTCAALAFIAFCTVPYPTFRPIHRHSSYKSTQLLTTSTTILYHHPQPHTPLIPILPPHSYFHSLSLPSPSLHYISLSLSLSVCEISEPHIFIYTRTSMVQSKKFRGVRQRQWGSWVSEIRHPLL